MVSGVTRDTYLISEKNPNNFFFIMKKNHFQKSKIFKKIENFEKSENVDF